MRLARAIKLQFVRVEIFIHLKLRGSMKIPDWFISSIGRTFQLTATWVESVDSLIDNSWSKSPRGIRVYLTGKSILHTIGCNYTGLNHTFRVCFIPHLLKSSTQSLTYWRLTLTGFRVYGHYSWLVQFCVYFLLNFKVPDMNFLAILGLRTG